MCQIRDRSMFQTLRVANLVVLKIRRLLFSPEMSTRVVKWQPVLGFDEMGLERRVRGMVQGEREKRREDGMVQGEMAGVSMHGCREEEKGRCAPWGEAEEIVQAAEALLEQGALQLQHAVDELLHNRVAAVSTVPGYPHE